jgi:Anti-sigma-K factor rskA, C-terminal
VIDSGSQGARFAAALAPTELVPDARGQAMLTKTSPGWRIELRATRLPRLADGRFYEAWLRNSAGVLVPGGTFNAGRGRRGRAQPPAVHRLAVPHRDEGWNLLIPET